MWILYLHTGEIAGYLDQLHVECQEEDPDQAEDAPAVGNGQVDVGAEAGPRVDHAYQEYVREGAEEERQDVE